MKKCAWVRSNREGSEKSCPFGLPITEACKNAGSSVTHMCPLEIIPDDSKLEKVLKANRRVYIYYKENVRCIYAMNIIEKLKSVNCDFGDVGQGLHTPPIEGSPLYPQTFAGLGLSGLYAYPLGFYSDNNESRNLFQGLFSLVGSKNDYLVKDGEDKYTKK